MQYITQWIMWIIIVYGTSVIICYPFILVNLKNWNEEDKQRALFHIVNYKVIALVLSFIPFYNFIVAWDGFKYWLMLKIVNRALKKLYKRAETGEAFKSEATEEDKEIYRNQLKEVIESIKENSSLKE